MILLCSSLFFIACAPGSGADGQSAAGGVPAPAEYVNLKNIDIVDDGDQKVITLSLMSGSRNAGYSETKLTQLPAYTVNLLEQPQRLMIKFDGICFWDYEEKNTWALSDFISGVFREVPADDDSLIVCFQLTKNASFTTEESEGNLVIRLTPEAGGIDALYYCVCNAFLEHQEGTWPEDIDLMPVLCADKQNKLLISKPFGTQNEALAFAEKANENLKAAFPDKVISVIQIAAGALPDYSADIDYSLAEERGVLLQDGVLLNTPVLLQNGRYLAASKDGRIAFSRTYQPGEPSLEQDSYLLSEKLWILDPNGRIKNIDTPDFFSIDEAAFSVDGRYIALLDVSIENRVLYVYDFETQTLYNLGEEGFGSLTASFAWSDSTDELYAMTGTDAMQLMSCIFLPDGSVQVAPVEEEPGAQGRLAVFNGTVYYADSAAGQVYEIATPRRNITSGDDIKISPDGKSLLVLDTYSTVDEQVLTSLKLCDIESGVTKDIVTDAQIIDFSFVGNENLVYYTDALVNSAAEESKYGLYSYDVASGTRKQTGMCSTPEFVSTDGKIYFISFIDSDGSSFYATYVYDPNA